MQNKDNFSYQSALFGYLTPVQKGMVSPVLRMLKKWVQDELCCALLDYIEKGEEVTYNNVMLECAFCYLTKPGMTGLGNEAIINPKNIEKQ